MRDQDGEIRHKRRDTLVGTLRDEHEAFAAAAEIRKRHGQGPLK